MNNIIIGERERKHINNAVENLLKNLGNTETKLDLKSVRNALDLDKQFFTRNDEGSLREFVSQIRFGSKRVLKEPKRLLRLVKEWDIKALYLPEKKKIMIDKNVPQLKRRFIEAHEIGHSIISWHEDYLFGDDNKTLNKACHEVLEAEANYSAGRLLFLGNHFPTVANDYHPDLENIVNSISGVFGNTITSTFWRFIEEAHKDIPMVGLITEHPHHRRDNFKFDEPCRYMIGSEMFKERFSKTNSRELYEIVKGYCGWGKKGWLGEDEMFIVDDRSDSNKFLFKSFSNSYDVLTLGVMVQ